MGARRQYDQTGRYLSELEDRDEAHRPELAKLRRPASPIFRTSVVLPARRGPTIRTVHVSSRASSARRSISRSNMPPPNLGRLALLASANWESTSRQLGVKAAPFGVRGRVQPFPGARRSGRTGGRRRGHCGRERGRGWAAVQSPAHLSWRGALPAKRERWWEARMDLWRSQARGAMRGSQVASDPG